jgi:flagellar motor switch protein FliG
LEQVDPAVVAEVEQGLRQTLAASSCETANRPVGRAVIEAILQAAGDEQRQALLEHLDPDDLRSPPSGPVLPPPSPLRADEDLLAGRTTCDGAQQLLRLLAEPTSDRAAPSSGDGRDPASDLTDNVLAFGDFLTLDDSALAKIFRAADAQITLLALCGASRELIDRIARRLPPRESRALGRKLEALGPTRLSDIESAQRHLAELASQMADAGQIQVPGFRRFTVAV